MSRRIDRPEEGFYVAKLVKNGPIVPVRIYLDVLDSEPGNPDNLMDRRPMLMARVGDDDEPIDALDVWPSCRDRIDLATYSHMLRQIEWARTYAPWAPEANPRKPIDFDALAVPTFDSNGDDIPDKWKD